MFNFAMGVASMMDHACRLRSTNSIFVTTKILNNSSWALSKARISLFLSSGWNLRKRCTRALSVSAGLKKMKNEWRDAKQKRTPWMSCSYWTETLTQTRHMASVTVCSLNCYQLYTECFMESASVRFLRTSWWSIRNRKSELSEQVEISDTNQQLRKYRTKHFPCGIVFIIYVLRSSLNSLNDPFNEQFRRRYSNSPSK